MSNKQEKLRIIPIGGLGEVGKNMMVYEYNGQILIVDAGLMFPDNDMLGVDYIIPDFKYLVDQRRPGPGDRHHPRTRGPYRMHPAPAGGGHGSRSTPRPSRAA